MTPPYRPVRPRRRGCAGCLLQVALVLLAGGVLVCVLDFILAPWNFYFGGHFHLLPGWTGTGWMHSASSGGDYYLFVRFNPTTPGYRKSPLQGTAYLCTPRGERFSLHFGGNMPRNHGTDLRGVPISLGFYNWPIFGLFTSERRPSFSLYGTFGNSELIMDDRGSLARAFRPDGRLYAPRASVPWKQESTHITLKEDPSWVFIPTCPAMPKAQ